MTSENKKEISLAILDDYANAAPKHFQHLLSNLQISSFPQTLNPSSSPQNLETLVQRLEEFEIISTMRERTPFPKELLQRLPKLQVLLTTGLRNSALDLDFAREKGVLVLGSRGERRSPNQDDEEEEEEEAGEEELPPPKGWSAVNQHTWALLLSLCSRIPHDDRSLKTSPKSWQSGLGISLAGKTLGVVGLGKLGSALARTAILGFGMRVLAWSENLTQARADDVIAREGLPGGAIRVVGKEELFRKADVVSLHLVLGERTRGIVGERELGFMKKRGILVNSSRGGLVHEGSLVEVLKSGGIWGAALDVFDQEPLGEGSVWRECEGWKGMVVLSPHMGYVNSGTINRYVLLCFLVDAVEEVY
ncbi:related to phosphoglycerate dehydrogenase and related dehydrogenases [Ramularia collo-cygni]|uniref:Related to phosphoglycerate dehydrogenase and related dehydrogenases n=1 Tax=Ramularia collo-cygni TaxID=112498 RepID=A0A2D3V670_9PEZI|nr:related to phosphoglycerate dehydrogenase and related dehydrogenases [Ramularia collo-cygni]CZT22195.1 related to phosphoglycerate dehydrogenase and related dehydrogenases [Ramularia collo-cygni]